MNWETLKSTKEVALDGITIEIEKSDAAFTSVVLTDASGRKLRVYHNSYAMQVQVPAKPKTEKKYALAGEYKGIPVDEKFDSEWDAKQRHRELDNDDKLAVAEVEVEIPF